MFTTALLVTIFLVLFIILFIRLYPPLGRKASKGILSFSKQNVKGKFVNETSTSMKMSAKESLQLLRNYAKRSQDRRPKEAIPVEPLWLTDDEAPRVAWFGHSAVLIELEGKRIFVDPMLGKAPTPFPLFSNNRYSEKLPLTIEELPLIDFVLFSHDHYDHLDYHTVKKLKDKVGKFYVPLGLGSHLIHWGVEENKIIEMDWWEQIQQDQLTFVCTPARHFSGRSINDRDRSLWCSWVMKGQSSNLFFSGDSGYGPHFAEIGERYGPFDLTMMECGQYDERWSAIHMTPEETVQAQVDVQGKRLIPIHWGAFTLSLHAWTDPIDRVTQEAERRNVVVATPKIGKWCGLTERIIPILSGGNEKIDCCFEKFRKN